MFRYNIICFFILYNFISPIPLYNNNQNSKENLIESLINYFDLKDVINKSSCLNESTKNYYSYFELMYYSSSFNKNDVNTYKTCINYNESISKGNFIYLTALINQKNSLYNVLTMKETNSEFLTGLCFINGCKEEDYQKILLSAMNKVYNINYNNINNTNITLNEVDSLIDNANKFSENDVKIFIFDSYSKDNIFITLLELIPFIIITFHIFFALFSDILVYIINFILYIFCCKKNQIKKIKSRSTINRVSKLKDDKIQPSLQPMNTERISSAGTIKAKNDSFQKSLEILYNVKFDFSSLSPHQQESQLMSDSGSSYINGLKGIFMIFLLFGNVYMALYGCFMTEKNKKNFFLQLKNFLFFFFYIGIRYAPKMLLCAGGFSLFFKFIFFLDRKMDEEIEIIKQNEEGNKDPNSSGTRSNSSFNKLNKNKEKPILSYKYLFNFYLKQLNKYIIYILFLFFFIFSFNKSVTLLRYEKTPLWEFFNEKIIKTSKKVYYLIPILLGYKSHIIPLLLNNEEINLLDYFYLPCQEIIFFLITSFIIFVGYRNNYKIDRFFKVLGIFIFIYRIIFYVMKHLDNKDYFNYHEFGKFFNSMLYNYNFHIIGIIFGMINYVLQKGYAERDSELLEKIYLFSSAKLLKTFKRAKRKTLNIIVIISLIVIILISFFQQIIASFYGNSEEEITNYKNNIFSQIILFFDSDLFVILSYLVSFCQYIKGENILNTFLCHNFWSIFNNFYFTFIILINPVILYIIYTTDTKIIFSLSNCFLFTFICGILVFIITIAMYSFFELPLKKLIQYLMKTSENNDKERLSITENNNQDANFMDNVTASLTEVIDVEEEEEK